MQNNKKIKFLENNTIKKILLIICVLAIMLIALENNSFAIETIEGRRNVSVNIEEDRVIEYKIDKNYLLQLVSIKTEKGIIKPIKHYTSQTNPNKVYLEIRGIKEGEEKIKLTFHYANTKGLTEKLTGQTEILTVNVNKKNREEKTEEERKIEENKLEGEENKTSIEKQEENKKIKEEKKQEKLEAEETKQNTNQEAEKEITVEEITEIYKNAKKKEDKQREEKLKEDNLLRKKIDKEEFIQKSLVLFFGITIMAIHYYKYIKYEKD